ncbi:disulfide bond formation protein DsbB [Bacillus mesophilus]|uniref:Probable disulfide formation protein n=1 Tax=Bacillus mesophilus TaxID=1808955 RepID=A0A6M0QBT4_9BACI|nr:disulfide oxidoreductase [Bacillus mesophilus]MBM7660072.1 disulfide bond formation protein DsbB [Bacillus mesophilus]NEY73727.1 disulfide bond formation protein B [Bacillus mesophilus]
MKPNKHKQIETLFFSSWAISVIAAFGSLFFSEVLKYIPCELCWYQRILMYPLVILMGTAIIKKDYHTISPYILPLSILGMTISLYHYLIQKVDFMSEASISCGVVPCTGEYINWFGFITIPFLALSAFTFITVLQVIILKLRKDL